MSILHRFSKDYPKPCITEMGGKNPAIIMPSADLDAAAEGVMRSAFGLQGQKCSACSRVYVHEAVKDRFTEQLLAREDRGISGGRPEPDGVFLGPVIHERAFQSYERYAAIGRSATGKVLTGARSLREGELPTGASWPRRRGRARQGARALLTRRCSSPSCASRRSRLEEGLLWRIEPSTGSPQGCSARRSPRSRRSSTARSRGRLREPARGGHYGRLAGRAALRRLEGERVIGQGLGWPLLRPAVHEGAVPHHRPLTSGHPELVTLSYRYPESFVFHRPLGREMRAIDRGSGALLWDREGRRYIDGSAGAVVVNVGHGRVEVADAMARQAAAAAYVHGTQFTSDVIEEYARRLALTAPDDCNRLYLVSGGSEANETAVKLARAYHLANGRRLAAQGDTRFDLVPRQTPSRPCLSRVARTCSALRPMLQPRPRPPRRSAITAPSAGRYPDVRGRLRRRAGRR